MARENGVGVYTNGDNGSTREVSLVPLTSKDGAQRKVELKDKVALIVGGASDNGRSLAVAFAERGIDVVIVYFNGNHEMAKIIKRQVETKGRRCLLIAGDELDEEVDENFSAQAVRQIIETFGRLDIFINYSGHVFPFGRIWRNNSEPERPIRSQLFPHFNMMKAALNEILS